MHSYAIHTIVISLFGLVQLPFNDKLLQILDLRLDSWV